MELFYCFLITWYLYCDLIVFFFYRNSNKNIFTFIFPSNMNVLNDSISVQYIPPIAYII